MAAIFNCCLVEKNMNFRKKDFWPPQSPDLNPLDYSIWWHIQNRACKVRHSNTEELKSLVNRAWASMRKDYVRTVCKAFRSRQQRVIEANGQHTEH